MGGAGARLAAWLAVPLLAYAILCLLAYIFQRGFIYFPLRWDEASARRANPGYEEVRIPTSDGLHLHGWLRRRPGAPRTVVIFHGNGGNLRFQEGLMHPFVALDLQVLLFDYRGFGLSGGAPTEEGLIRDGESVVDFVAKSLGVGKGEIVYYGKSLGSGVAVRLAVRRPPDRLILESSYDSLVSVARYHYPFLPAGLLLRDRFDAARAIGGVRCPVLFLHPGRDEIIPPSMGRALFDRAGEPKRLVEIPGAGHNDPPSASLPLYLRTLRSFLELPEEGS